MNEQQTQFQLQPHHHFATTQAGVFYRLEQGTADVYIQPLREDSRMRPHHYCTVTREDRHRAIPALCYTDSDGCRWQFVVRAGESGAVFTIQPLRTQVPLRRFLERREAADIETLAFEERMVRFYSSRTLDATQTLFTGHAKEICRVEQGNVYVYVVPMEGTRPGRALYVCEISSTDPTPLIPGLEFTDRDGKVWRMMLRSVSGEARLRTLSREADAQLHRAFLERLGITTYAQEGYENSLVEFYRRRCLQDRVFIRKDEHQQSSVSRDTDEVIRRSFQGGEEACITGSPAYRALQFLSGKLGVTVPDNLERALRTPNDPKLPDLAAACNLLCRSVVLEENWHKRDCGYLVARLEEQTLVCFPVKDGYRLYRTDDATTEPVTDALARQISPKAYVIGRTLPRKRLNMADVAAFCAKSIHSRDLVPYTVLVLLCALIGVLLPTLNSMVYDDYIPVGNTGNLAQLCVLMFSFMLGNVAFSIVKNLFGFRLTSRLGNDLQEAVYHRLFHLPESFFRKYDSADLAQRVSAIGALASQCANTLILTGITAAFSVVYLIRMIRYNGKLTAIALLAYGCFLVMSLGITAFVRKGRLRIARAESEAGSKLYQYLNGADKLRMAGAEDRAVLSYMRPFGRIQRESIRLNRLLGVEEALTTVVSYLFSMVFYWYIVARVKPENLSVGTFVAFTSAFGAFTGALDSFIDQSLSLWQEQSEVRRFWPIFRTAPEDTGETEIPGTLSGGLELEHISFRYDRNAKNVLSNLSLRIAPGEYVGIVGPSGCGKSTLLKLMLGFETPQQGKILVDGKDLQSLNKQAYRRQLGTVLQNGRLISGSIYENITVTAPEATMAHVKEVVKKVGLADDIAQMPMGLHTMLSETGSTLSGGQQQRILIARAICGSPRVLLFDEATSALDNLTQAAVSHSLDEMKVTRIVVAHRLSTVRHCHRIIVLEEGRIIQEGNYETLMQDKNGLFYQLASRQIAD